MRPLGRIAPWARAAWEGPRVGVLDRYLLREVGKSFAAILVTFCLVMVTLLFLRLFETVAVGQLNPDLLLSLVGLQTLRYLPRLLPLAFYFGLLLVLMRMHRDSEMIALAAGGIGPGHIYRAVLLPALPLALVAGWFSLQLSPWASAEANRVLAQQKQRGAELAGLRPGRFNEYSKGDLVVYVESIEDQRTMRNLFVQHRRGDALSLVTAASGDYRFDPETGEHRISLQEGRRYEGRPGLGEYSIAHFDRYTLRIAREEARPTRKRTGLPTAELWRSSGQRDSRAELEERFSYPLSLITLALIALPLSRSLPRQGMYGRLFAAFLVYVSFLNLHSMASSWLESGRTPLWLGMWWLQGLLLAIAGLVWMLEAGGTRRLRRHWQDRRAGAGGDQRSG